MNNSLNNQSLVSIINTNFQPKIVIIIKNNLVHLIWCKKKKLQWALKIFEKCAVLNKSLRTNELNYYIYDAYYIINFIFINKYKLHILI